MTHKAIFYVTIAIVVAVIVAEAVVAIVRRRRLVRRLEGLLKAERKRNDSAMSVREIIDSERARIRERRICADRKHG